MLIAFVLMFLGFVLGVWRDPQWTSGIGAAVVVVGVVFAATDLPKVLEQRARNIANITNALVLQHLINDLEEREKRVISANERTAMTRRFDRLNAAYVEQQASQPRKRFLWVEVGIVCAGTLMNGFGTWIASAIRNGI
jgi:hypothetical protein